MSVPVRQDRTLERTRRTLRAEPGVQSGTPEPESLEDLPPAPSVPGIR